MNHPHQARPLQPGDRVIVVDASYFEEWNDTEATVRSPLSWRRATDLHLMRRVEYLGYSVELGDGMIVNAGMHQVIPIFPDESTNTDEVVFTEEMSS